MCKHGTLRKARKKKLKIKTQQTKNAVHGSESDCIYSEA